MKRVLTVVFLIMLACSNIAYATEYAITPLQKISTVKDDTVEFNCIRFMLLKNIIVDKKVVIPVYSTITGVVSEVNSNGFFNKDARIILDKFFIRDINGKSIKIDYKLTINPKECKKTNKISRFLIIKRGKEINIEQFSQKYYIEIRLDNIS